MCGVISTGKGSTFYILGRFWNWCFGNNAFLSVLRVSPSYSWQFCEYKLTFHNFLKQWFGFSLTVMFCIHAGEVSSLWWCIGSLLQWFLESSGKVVLMHRCCGTKLWNPSYTLTSFFQSFPESLLYNQETGLFEVASGAAELVSRRIRSVLSRSKSQLTGDPKALTRTPPVDNHYTICVSSEKFLNVESNSWIYLVLKMSRNV